MKKSAFFVIILLAGLQLKALDTKSAIKEVIVYQNGAKIVREAYVNITPGNTEVVFTDLTSSLKQSSLQVELEGNAILLSATTRINYLKENENSRQVKILQDSITLIDNQLKILAGEKSVYIGEEKLINENNKLGSEQVGVQVTELKLLADFYRTRLMDIKKQLVNIESREQDLKNAKTRIQRQLNELNAAKNKPTGEVVLTLAANSAVKVKVRISYLTSSAGWYPVYDIRSETTNKPIKLVYKANVYQSTGYDWKDVQMAISTRNPEADQNRPVLNPWYIDFYQPVPQVYQRMKATGAPAPSAMNIYQEAETKEEAAAPPIQYQVTETSGMMATEYTIENRQSIPSDSKEHMVAIKDFEVDAKYTYHAVPKLSDGVFLIAKLTDYGKLGLLPGKANLFNQGMYVGQSDINPFTTADTMMVSLGRDERISIKRTELKDLTARQTIGANIKETKGYQLLIKNNKSVPVDLEVLDNIPLSKNKDIEVNLDNDGGAEYTKEYGRLLWRLNLKPGESKKIDYSFSVKYPKDRQISGL